LAVKNLFPFACLVWTMACQPSAKQTQLAPAPGQPVCVRVVYERDGESRPAQLCVQLFQDDTLLTSHSLWYLADSAGTNRLLGSSFANGEAFPLSTYGVSFSENGQFGALMMVGEGHPWIEVFEVSKILRNRSYQTHFMLNPYPGSIEVVRWDQNRLIVESEMPLERIQSDSTNSFDLKDYEAAEQNGHPFHQFAFDPLTKTTVRLPK
jgi:hypothetical protein